MQHKSQTSAHIVNEGEGRLLLLPVQHFYFYIHVQSNDDNCPSRLTYSLRGVMYIRFTLRDQVNAIIKATTMPPPNKKDLLYKRIYVIYAHTFEKKRERRGQRHYLELAKRKRRERRMLNNPHALLNMRGCDADGRRQTREDATHTGNIPLKLLLFSSPLCHILL